MKYLNDFNIDKFIDNISTEDLQFLKLTGYEAYYSQRIYGQDVIIAVADTGVTPHEELKGNVIGGKSFVDYTNSYYDDNGHGTHVAASIAGKNVGVARLTKILPVKVLDKDGYGNLSDLIRGLYWISDYKVKYGANITAVNLSLSSSNNEWEVIDVLHEAIKTLVENNIAVIASAGNSGETEITYPAAYDEVISVGAVDINKRRALFSTMGNYVDLCQIGVNVLSAWYEGGYAVMSGTSMSTALVSGIAALISSKHSQVFNQSISEDYLYKSLKLNTKDLGVRGTDIKYGAGFCTLQPLELEMRLKSNSNRAYVNGKKIRLNNNVDIDGDRIIMPMDVLPNYTGAYARYDGKKGNVEFIY